MNEESEEVVFRNEVLNTIIDGKSTKLRLMGTVDTIFEGRAEESYPFPFQFNEQGL
jgi:hypothetical protein